MRKWLTLLWLLLGVGVVIYHFNGGRAQVQRERAYVEYRNIVELERGDKPDWKQIVELYDKLAVSLPAGEDLRVRREVRLAKCRAMLEALQIRSAVDQLQVLLDETSDAYGELDSLTQAVRATMGRAQFMAGWVLQQIGAPDQKYQRHYDRSRQIFRYLAEHDDEAAYKRYQRRIGRSIDEVENAD
jgi:predicted negative regulator of RcsB-dependent stress response